MKFFCCNHMHMVKNSEFLRKDKVRGIIRIENMLSGKIYLVKSSDVVKDYSRLRFALDMGDFENEEVQNDYTATGLELFDISLDQEAKEDDDLEALLNNRKKYYEDIKKELYRQ